MTPKRKTAATCLTLNLVLPGAGTLLIGRTAAGIIQLLVSLGALALFAKGAAGAYRYCLRLLDGAPANEGYLAPLLWTVSSLLVFKISFIWAQLSTARFYKETRRREERETGNEAPPIT